MTDNITIDLETLGVGTHPVLLSLGAVRHRDGEILDEFHVGIDPTSCQDAGLRITPSTVMWWMAEELDEARKALLSLERVDLHSAMMGFRDWYGEPNAYPVWGNGASSDNVWLRSAFEAVRVECPFKFYMDRCYRTMKNLVPGVQMERDGLAHDALGDARSQAKHLDRILSLLQSPQVMPEREQVSVPDMLVDEGLRIIERDARQYRIYQENHERKGRDITLSEMSRSEALGKAATNQRLAEESEAFLAKIKGTMGA